MMPRKTRNEKGGGRNDRRRDGGDRKSRYGEAMMPRKKSHALEGVKQINSGDYEFLRKFLTEHGKIIPSRITGATALQQRKIKRAIRRARAMGLLM